MTLFMINLINFDKVKTPTLSNSFKNSYPNSCNKTVLLRERKRHTAATWKIIALLSCIWRGILQPVLARGTPSWPGWGDIPGYPTWDWDTPASNSDTPCTPGRDLRPVTGVPREGTWDQLKYYGIEMRYPSERTCKIQLPSLQCLTLWITVAQQEFFTAGAISVTSSWQRMIGRVGFKSRSLLYTLRKVQKIRVISENTDQVL